MKKKQIILLVVAAILIASFVGVIILSGIESARRESEFASAAEKVNAVAEQAGEG